MAMHSYQNFLQTASVALLNANSVNAHSALLVVNLEGLPELDGILGYSEVDAILDQLVQQLSQALNATDIVGPSGRYQVCCLLTDLLTDNHALLAAHKILRIFALSFQFKKRRITLLPRIGVALNSGNVNQLQQLMCNASSALHQARCDKAPVRLFDEKEKNLLLSGIDIWSELDRAIETGELQLVYQPQLWIATGKIRSTEALLRWNHPSRGNIPPDQLVHVAEGTELMIKLSLWVFNTALRQCAEYRRAGVDAGVSINLSAGDLCDPELVDLIEQAVNIWNVAPSDVMIELTETAIMGDQPGSLETLHALKNIGFKLAMDDFGTGYSSMERLLQLPLDEVKIDRMFIRGMLNQPAYERIVETMINMGHQLGLDVIAEGVEDLATFERLRTLGCDVVQGYFVGAGMPIAALIEEFAAMNQNSVPLENI
ncbi:EAL domain, c-di-GMP-specific phosphodiesterase class I (or its enzymatically inactive variant) [Nitrosomonas aestuarii]|uniref:EAL domain, c-di-GMP-specific phosphodiesterase class I (Or its enzymatically inactive variant) n=1 Tax=Nitrosomonas aestuarii TaxID=52441 RepID=A0A1I4BIE9_9PROT|nr:GGDEF domain-containing phosphodiesterase [Nitrosomonas aestuarii]SFK67789.1 EAL domain, c-di-GMP-specific phosphodiesterase class I (or its enzymatically inactive variant) [Nitrosomonas aestuarii]